jgi:hypothetical protein
LQLATCAAVCNLKKDLNEVIQFTGYKLLFSMSTIFAGLLSVFVAVGGDLVAPWLNPKLLSNKKP